jgi:inner membrane protein COX18
MLRSTSQNFFALPPANPLSLYEQSLQRSIHPPPRRAFSATTSRKFDPYRTVLSVPATLLDAVHSTGLPWFATIPAAAILVRGVLIYYTCTKPAHLNRNKISHLQPLISARASSMARHVPRPKEKAAVSRKLSFYIAHFFTYRKVLRRIKDQFGIAHTWKTLVPTYLSLIVMAEAIRVRCGASKGLLQALLSPFSWWDNLVNPPPVVLPKFLEPYLLEPFPRADVSSGSNVATASTADASSGSGVATAPVTEAVEALDLSVSNVDTAPATEQPVEALSHVDLSGFSDLTLTVEGLPWFPDLTVADPTGTLPLLLFFSLWVPAMARFLSLDVAPAPRITDMTKAEADAAVKKYADGAKEREKTINRHSARSIGSTFVAFTFMVVMTKLPAGILLYIITNQVTAMVQRSWLDFKYPMGKTIRPCPRPMRKRVRNSFASMKYE